MRYYHSISLFGRSFSVKIVNEKVFNISFLAVKKPSKETVGMTSRCRDGKHVLFFDFDGLNVDEIREELSYLQGYYGLSDFFVFKNDFEDSFHAVCLDKFTLYDAIEIISNSSADRGFKKAPILFRQKRWVLRVAPKGNRKKPIFFGKIASKVNNNQISTAHRLFLNYHYGTNIPKKKNEDGLDASVGLCGYNTGSNC